MKLLKLSDLVHFWGNVRKHIPTKTSDLTNDSNFAVNGDVIHKSGDETSTGFKQFDNIRANNSIKGINLADTTTDLDNCYSGYAPYGESKGGNIQYYYCNTDAGTANISNLPEAKAFFLTSITTRLISNSLYVKQTLVNSTNKTYTRYCANSTWSSWVNETDSEYAHKSGNETIAGIKTFSNDLIVANTDTTANTPNLSLRNYNADRGTTETAVQTIMFSDKNAKALTLIESRRISNGNTGTNILCYNTDDSNNTVSGGVSIIKSKTDTHFAPNADNAVTCGRPLAKWSDVQTYKVNNLEPSSLSLPSSRDSRVDISSYFTNTGTGNTNDYSVPANGYIFLNLLNAFAVICYSTDGRNNVNYAQSYFRPVDGQIYVLFPVRKNDTFRTLWTANGGTITVTGAYFIPCQGNV